MAKKINYYKLSLLIIIIGTLVRFILAIYYHPSGDACWHLSSARFMAENLKIPFLEHIGRAEPFWAPPMFHFITALFYMVAGDIGMRVVSPLFGSLTMYLVFLISKRLYSPRVAFFSVLFLTFLPIHLDYSVFGYVEALLVFLITLSVYLMMKNRVILSSVIFGIAILAKYNAVFILPALLYIIYRNARGCKKRFFTKSAVFLIISLAISLPWLIRNYLLLGNPIWPFFGFLFQSPYTHLAGSFNYLNLLSWEWPVSAYLGFFGVPDGNYSTLSFFQIPFFNFVIVLWIIGTLIFIYPCSRGMFKAKSILHIWIGGFLVLLLLYVLNASPFVSRIILPAVPAIAVLFGLGMNKNKLFLALILLISFGFVTAGATKVLLAAGSWNSYQEDFSWVKENTPENSVFLINRGQCFTYNFDRATVYYDQKAKADFIWINQNFRIDPVSVYNQTALSQIEGKAVYSNEETGTRILAASQPS